MKTLKKTTRIIDIITSIFINNCISEFENDCKNQITFFDDNFSYFKKINNFDDYTYELMNKHFFKDNVFKSKKADKEIKKIFFARFLNREIGRQTFEIFLSELVHIFYMYDDVLSFYYDNIEKFLIMQKENNIKNDNDNTQDIRSIYTTLPQDDINLNLNNDLMGYGDNNTISKTKNIQKGKSENVLNEYDYSIMLKYVNNNIVDILMKKIDEKCFSQVW